MISKDVQAEVQFLKWQEIYRKERPFNLFLELPPEAKEQRKTNVVFEDISIPIHDIRGEKDSFKPDENGFMVAHLPAYAGELDTTTIQEVHLPAVERLIKEKVEGADRILMFDWRVRFGDEKAHGDSIDIQNLSSPVKPANTAYIDTSPSSAIKRVQKEFGTETSEVLKSRVRIINVWRPVHHVMEDWPLAVCDGSTVDTSALVETDIVRIGKVSSNIFMMHRSCNRWYYLPQQKPEEVLIFKQFDTKLGIKARYCPHASFKSPIGTPNARSWRSIEVRASALTDS